MYKVEQAITLYNLKHSLSHPDWIRTLELKQEVPSGHLDSVRVPGPSRGCDPGDTVKYHDKVKFWQTRIPPEECLATQSHILQVTQHLKSPSNTFVLPTHPHSLYPGLIHTAGVSSQSLQTTVLKFCLCDLCQYGNEFILDSSNTHLCLPLISQLNSGQVILSYRMVLYHQALL